MASITAPIRLAENFRAVFYAPFYAAQTLGFFAREGVDVALVEQTSPGDGVAGVLDGTIDATWGGPMRVMKARDGDPRSPLVCFCEVVARDPFFLVGPGSGAPFKLTDLPRLRFAAVCEVPTPWMCLQHDLREQGIDPARLDRMPARPMAENIAALRRGELDVVQVFEPYVSMALQERIGEVLYAASTRGPTVYTTFIATRDALARNRGGFAAMTRAIGHMQAWLAEHDAEELATATAPFYPDIPGDLLARALARYRGAGVWARTPAVSHQGFARLADSLESGGFIARTPPYEDCVDMSGLGQ
jgi:NitT/TauT family transport system substrate-binding protein